MNRLKARAAAKVKKYERTGDEYAAAEAQEELDKIQAQIDNIQSNYDTDQRTVNDYEKDKKTRSELEDELKRLNNDELMDAIRKAKRESSSF